MAFCQSFMFSTYCSKEVYPSPLVEDLYLRSFVSFERFAESSMMPSLMFLPNFSQNSMYLCGHHILRRVRRVDLHAIDATG